MTKDLNKIQQHVNEMIDNLDSTGLFFMSLAPWQPNSTDIEISVNVRTPELEGVDVIKGVDLVLNGIEKKFKSEARSATLAYGNIYAVICSHIKSYSELCDFLYQVKSDFAKINIYPAKVFTYTTYGISQKMVEEGVSKFLGCDLKELMSLMSTVVEGEAVDVAKVIGFRFDSKYKDISLNNMIAKCGNVIPTSENSATFFINENKDRLYKYLYDEGMPERTKILSKEITDYVNNISSEADVEITEENGNSSEYSSFIGAYCGI